MKYYLVFSLLLFMFLSCQETSQTTEKQTNDSQTDSISQATSNITSMKAELLLDAKASLGEGALWNIQTQELYWIDIENELLHLYNPANQQDRAIKLGKKVGTVVPTQDGNALVALQDGIYEIDLKTEKKKLLVERPEKNFPNNRFNDGKCDPAGRFWVGTMSMEGKPKVGNLFCFDNEGKIKPIYDSVSISNGIVWSLDSTKMFYIDTPTKEIKEFDYNIQTGEASFKKVAVRIPEGTGYPDGMTIDNEGKLWVAMWEGYGVLRFDPENGELLMKVEVPVARVTSCAFGGEKLDILYITTASIGAKEEELKQYPYTGGLFMIKTGHTGIPNFAYKGKKKKMSIGF
ncbi:MAG: SMP-30/gluconolactonase/LRE family protein [Thermoflexibacter sp.]|nr:SMP-30/gluconolactonase/LRE family protein [Thermoflexibacter sp.]